MTSISSQPIPISLCTVINASKGSNKDKYRYKDCGQVRYVSIIIRDEEGNLKTAKNSL